MGSPGAFTGSSCKHALCLEMDAERVSGPLSAGRGSCTRWSFVDGIVLVAYIGLHKSTWQVDYC